MDKFVIERETVMKKLKTLFVLGIGFAIGFGVSHLRQNGLEQTAADVSGVVEGLSQDATIDDAITAIPNEFLIIVIGAIGSGLYRSKPNSATMPQSASILVPSLASCSLL